MMAHSAGVEGYASLLAAVTAAFPTPTRMVFLDHPTEEHLAPPLLPSDLNKSVAQRQGQLFRMGMGDASTSAAAPTAGKTQVSNIEPRRMPLESVLEYFCDTVGVVSAHGGTEDGHVSWFEIRIGGSTRRGVATQGQREGQGEIDVRYAIRLVAAEDGGGWSGRERFEVAFG